MNVVCYQTMFYVLEISKVVVQFLICYLCKTGKFLKQKELLESSSFCFSGAPFDNLRMTHKSCRLLQIYQHY